MSNCSKRTKSIYRSKPVQRTKIRHQLIKQPVSPPAFYAIDEFRRPKPYGQQLSDGFDMVNPDIY